ncbi:MAG: hypothetical protein U5K30_14105 [Acidimicrobiales bacterium]|nr:hypothetical protein [Acidimicrobiales bacterium]
MTTDAEFDKQMVAAMFEVEAQVLHAEAVVNEHHLDDLRWDCHLAQNPDGADARLEAGTKATVLAHEGRGFTDRRDAHYQAFLTEFCAYGWRRDYGEWPTTFNLTDRVANDCGITHRTAKRRITSMVKQPDRRPSPVPHPDRPHGLRSSPAPARPRSAPGTAGPNPSMRLYVAADGINSLMKTFYREAGGAGTWKEQRDHHDPRPSQRLGPAWPGSPLRPDDSQPADDQGRRRRPSPRTVFLSPLGRGRSG